jgi:hypothetical protein
MRGATILAALLSFGAGEKKTTLAPLAPEANTPSKSDDADMGVAPNPDAPWRAVCEEYAPCKFGEKNGTASTQDPGGHKALLQPNAPRGTTEIDTQPNRQGQSDKVAVQKQLPGDLPSCIPAAELAKINMIIATLPDSDNTEMRLVFDRSVDAVEKGAEERKFNYAVSGFLGILSKQERRNTKKTRSRPSCCAAKSPGALLFHNKEGKRLLILLARETPTSGTHRIQTAQGGESFGLTPTIPRGLSAVRALSDQQSDELAALVAKILSLAKTATQVKLSNPCPVERDRAATYASEDEATEMFIALEDRIRLVR